ncbi:thiamine-phosphate kinase [Ramlibacter rhizophilus]|uniref:Thiamine-monophosphate kinase n=1 Tax=Ramlibacter rhizophilus TaxID=1781167 RepID=A0A4Z0BFJ4_9BURK|nr:thiamine-phosphate kinase [Ramlibacter rhizophilus]TFY98115.1 thiamine-phosphate kinase [Ramlibacter rhizophilus]
MGEFELIDRFFRRPARHQPLGIGDDCAILAPRPGMQLAVSTDLLLEGRHFLSTVAPARLGHKALAVNLSDLAACGARPIAFTLALALPQSDEAWLEAFARGLLALADEHGCELVGGDTTRGPLAVCITVFGEVPAGQALLRSGAQPGDEVWASGTLGQARLALEAFRGRVLLPAELFDTARRRMEVPTPRVALGQGLRGVATAAIDLSDGLMGDLGHVLTQSRVGARLHVDELLGLLPGAEALPEAQRLECVLGGGDDYELLFTAPAAQHALVLERAAGAGTPVRCIGRIEAEPGLRLVDGQGRPVAARFASFDHFA